TAAAAEVLADVGWDPLPGRAGVFAPRSGEAQRLQAPTIVQLGSGPIVGRDDVLRSLLTAAEDATQRSAPAAITVLAEPGHGKTHLAAAFLEKLRAHLPGAELLELRAREPVPGDADETLRTVLGRALDLSPGGCEAEGRARFTAALGTQ